MILSVQPRIWLGQDVGTFEVLPPERGGLAASFAAAISRRYPSRAPRMKTGHDKSRRSRRVQRGRLASDEIRVGDLRRPGSWAFTHDAAPKADGRLLRSWSATNRSSRPGKLAVAATAMQSF